MRMSKMWANDILNIPYLDTTVWKPQKPGAILIRPADGLMYIWYGGAWGAVTGGGGGSSAWGSITGTLSSQTDLQAALNAKAASVHTHAESDVTGLAASLAAKASTSHTHGYTDLTAFPTQSGQSGKFLTTDGSSLSWGNTSPPDSSLFATFLWDKKGKDSLGALIAGKAATVHTHVISDVTSLQSTIDAKVADAITDGTTTIAPSQNSVFDVLNSNLFTRSPSQKVAQLAGSAAVFATLGKSQTDISISVALGDGSARFILIPITEAKTLTTVQYWQSVAGDYVANNYNGLALFSISGANLTLVGSTTDDGNIWKATAATLVTKAFSSPIAVTPGLYALYYLYNSSSQTTAPSLGAYANFVNAAVASAGLTNGAKFSSLITAQNSITTPQAWSGLTASTSQFYGEVY